MKNFLAFVGAGLICMWLMGSFGAGHFYLYFGEDKITCEKESAE
jgi:hypothetical protein